jgi:hypothetical protein
MEGHVYYPNELLDVSAHANLPEKDARLIEADRELAASLLELNAAQRRHTAALIARIALRSELK